MAIVAEGERGRIYLSPTLEHETIAQQSRAEWKPEIRLEGKCRVNVSNYGFDTYGDLFTSRQLVALTTFSDLVQEARERVLADALGARASRPQEPWHSRGYLPHWEAGEHSQHITFRLADSLPQELLEQWSTELRHLPPERQDLERRKRIEAALDAGYGACHLRKPEIAKLIEDALLHFDGTRYLLHAWVVMPNHVHVLVTPLHDNSLSSILHSWKSFTAKQANRMLGRTGAFWQEEYFDRAIRDDRHFAAAVEYVEQNPVKAGLCREVAEWPWGSACGEEGKRAGRPRSQDELPLAEGGTGAQAYADAVGVYLGMSVSKMADAQSSLCRWKTTMDQSIATFGRQALPMVWDYSEANAFGEMAGDPLVSLNNMMRVVDQLPARPPGYAFQADAQSQSSNEGSVVSIDPPYYDNIGYADLSDFFYVWLRRSLKPVFPDLFATLAVPKTEELVATPYRHGGKLEAEAFFLDGMTKAMHRLAEQTHPAFPVTIYYAFKQSETENTEGTSSTGWETFLDAVIRAGFAVSGTWPMRTELSNRMIGSGANALASSIVLVCRKRPADAPIATRREFVTALKAELPAALRLLQGLRARDVEMPPGARASRPQALLSSALPAGETPALPGIAPVDLAQAAIGPGMAVYTRYAQVLDAAGKPLTVREALALINQTLDEALAEQEGDFDADTRWAVAWFEQVGFNDGEYGVAETLSKAKNTSVAGMVDAGILASKGGKVRLLRPDQLPADWDPARDKRLTAWEAVHHLIRVLESGGERAAAELVARLGSQAEVARELAYRLYTVCERKKRAAEALSYNGLVQSWPEIVHLAQQGPAPGAAAPRSLFDEDIS
jgi:putative DNA methylase